MNTHVLPHTCVTMYVTLSCVVWFAENKATTTTTSVMEFHGHAHCSIGNDAYSPTIIVGVH